MPGKLPVLDKQILSALTDDVGQATAALLIESLKVEIDTAEKKLHEFADSVDLDLLENLAHGLKSAARSFGALRLGDICALLEENARAEADMALIESQLVLFKDVAAETIGALKKVRMN